MSPPHKYDGLKDALPKLAINIGWLKMIGEASVEQKRRQTPKSAPLSVSPAHAAHMERKRAARRANRSGLRGLLTHIATAA